MRIIKPKRKKAMSQEERKDWRSKWIERLVLAGIPLYQLAGITDHELWQKKNRHFGRGVAVAGPLRVVRFGKMGR